MLHIEGQVDKPDQLFGSNLNPIRVGLNMYFFIDEILNNSEYSQFAIEKIKANLETAIIAVVNSYSEPEDIVSLVESHDLFGKDCFFYIHFYDLSTILNTPIFDKYISFKWNGRITVQAEVGDFSTPYTVLKNLDNKMLGSEFIKNSFDHILEFGPKLKKIQVFGLTSWKHSIKIRFITESIVSFILTMYF
jgi:hypothetical protein